MVLEGRTKVVSNMPLMQPWNASFWVPLLQWSPTLGLQMFLDFNSQKSWPAEVVVKVSGSCSPRTSGGPKLGTTRISHHWYPSQRRSRSSGWSSLVCLGYFLCAFICRREASNPLGLPEWGHTRTVMLWSKKRYKPPNRDTGLRCYGGWIGWCWIFCFLFLKCRWGGIEAVNCKHYHKRLGYRKINGLENYLFLFC